MLEILGWIGSILFSLSAIPQSYKSYKDGNSDGISDAFIWMWLVGEICMLIYILPTLQYPLICNYLFNLMCLSFIFKYRYFPRRAT